ncbi:MAG: tyrosine-type recombinase/integrase [Capsulimonadales bacterium]|nr:tyrosine-type recombinase/integrase [Capsulimonadales bacterium]
MLPSNPPVVKGYFAIGRNVFVRWRDGDCGGSRPSLRQGAQVPHGLYLRDDGGHPADVFSTPGEMGGNPYLFPDEYGTGALEYSSFQHAMYRANQKAKVDGVRVSPHTLRHSFAREWTLAGGDIASLSAQLGHSDLQVTSRYVHILGSDRAEVQQRVSPLERLGVATQKKKRL